MCKIQAYEVVIGSKKINVLKVDSEDFILRNAIVSNLFLNQSISNWFKNEEEMYEYYNHNIGEIFEYQFNIIF